MAKECKTVKLNWTKLIAAIVAIVIVGQVIHTFSASMTMGYYMDPAYQSVWSPIMMPSTGAPPTMFMVYSMGFGAITALFFTLIYTLVGCCVPGKTPINRGLTYGLLIFLVGGFPSIMTTYLIINIPVGLVSAWAIESLAINLIGGLIVAYFLK